MSVTEVRGRGNAPFKVRDAVQRHWGLVLLPVVLLVAVAGAYGMKRTPTYTAQSKLTLGQLDVESLDLSPVAKMIARAAQRYGMVVRDGSELVTFYGEDPTPTGSNPWPGWFRGKSPGDALAGFPWDRLQALPPVAG